MYTGKLMFAQEMEVAPWYTFRRLVATYVLAAISEDPTNSTPALAPKTHI